MSTKHLACVLLLACMPLLRQNDSPPMEHRTAKSEPLDARGSTRNACGFEVLNDRAGIELGTYADQLVEAVREKWYSIIAGSLGETKSRTTVIDFVLRERGELGKMRVQESSGEKALDTAAWKAIQEAVPFPF